MLEVTAGARVPALIVVRGDAYRSTGHEQEASEAYAIAARGGLRSDASAARQAKSRAASSKKSAASGDAVADARSQVAEAAPTTAAAETAAEAVAVTGRRDGGRRVGAAGRARSNALGRVAIGQAPTTVTGDATEPAP